MKSYSYACARRASYCFVYHDLSQCRAVLVPGDLPITTDKLFIHYQLQVVKRGHILGIGEDKKLTTCDIHVQL